MSTDLVQINNSTAIQQVQVEQGDMDFSSHLFNLSPVSLVINQPQTQDDNAKKGYFRITQTGDQYESLTVSLLYWPEESRAYYVGEEEMNRKPENLMCFSRATGCQLKAPKGQQPNKTVGPDKASKDPQNPTCFGCEHSSWDKYRLYATKNPNQKVPGNLRPKCDPYYYVPLIDTTFQMPMEMWIRGGSVKPFEAAMQNLSRKMWMYKVAKKENPKVYQFKFQLKTKLISEANRKFYILDIPGNSFEVITEEEKESFGGMFAAYTEGQKSQPVSAADKVNAANHDINDAVNAGISGEDETIAI